MSVGIDIVQTERIRKAMENPRFAEKILTPEEISSGTPQNIQSTAASFAAKEAFSKAVGTGFRGFGFEDISVLHEPSGKPYFRFSERVENMLNAMGVSACDLSLSHEKDYAIATVILECSKEFGLYNKAIRRFEDCEGDNIITPSTIENIITKREESIHKGDCGRLFLLAGSKGLTGAAIMASKAALRCGAGLITLGCPKSLNHIFECCLTEVMTLPLEDEDGVLSINDSHIICDKAKASDCTLAGPGLTCCDAVAKITELLTESCSKTLVLDADSINALAKNINILNNRKCDIILTPHIGEFSRLTGMDSREILSAPASYAKNFATKHSLTLVLKSHRTVVATAEGKVYTNILGNPGMATGGTGDVLAGSIASFAAQGMSCEDAALAGVYIHSLAADMAAEELGEYGLTPGDIITALPYAIKFSLKSGM